MNLAVVLWLELASMLMSRASSSADISTGCLTVCLLIRFMNAFRNTLLIWPSSLNKCDLFHYVQKHKILLHLISKSNAADYPFIITEGSASLGSNFINQLHKSLIFVIQLLLILEGEQSSAMIYTQSGVHQKLWFTPTVMHQKLCTPVVHTLTVMHIKSGPYHE